jgi:hypothetical protein
MAPKQTGFADHLVIGERPVTPTTPWHTKTVIETWVAVVSAVDDKDQDNDRGKKPKQSTFVPEGTSAIPGISGLASDQLGPPNQRLSDTPRQHGRLQYFLCLKGAEGQRFVVCQFPWAGNKELPL